MVYDRAMTSYQTFPDLQFRAKPEQKVQGVLMFEMPNDSRFTHFLYTESNAQLYFAGEPRPEITISGDLAANVVKITSQQSFDTKCTGVDVWAQSSAVSMRAASDAVDDVTNNGRVVTPSCSARMRRRWKRLQSIRQV